MWTVALQQMTVTWTCEVNSSPTAQINLTEINFLCNIVLMQIYKNLK